MGYKSKLERFDLERGDVLSLPRETCLELSDLDENDASRILLSLVKYVAGNPGDPLPTIEDSDPRMQKYLSGTLSRLIEHQKRNAARRADYLKSQQDKANARWSKDRPDAVCSGIPRDTTVCQGMPSISISKDKDKAEELLSLSVSDKSDSDSPSVGGLGINADPNDMVKIYYPSDDIEEEWCDKDPYCPEPISKTDFITEPIGVMMKAMDVFNDDAKVRNTLAARRRDAGSETFIKICWEFLKDWEGVSNRYISAIRYLHKICNTENIEFKDLKKLKPNDWKLLQDAKSCLGKYWGSCCKILFGRLKPYHTTK